jgi:L-ascorbate metabolism protein UlaG (beta-lactamase superfamily)
MNLNMFKSSIGIADFLLTFVLLGQATTAMAQSLEIERLTWAGVKLVSGDTTVFVDAVGKDLWDGKAPEGLVPVTADTGRRYALITHAHNDHFDVDTLKQVLGEKGYVICHESIATYVASRGLQVIPAAMYTPVMRGGFVFTAVPAEDGLGSEQVNWVITNGDKRIFHGGDTLWHGQWNTIGTQYGPFDVAFMPINGARLANEPKQETPAVLTPSQAVDAAISLRASQIVPIHFGLNDPPFYVEVEKPLATLKRNARRRHMKVRHMIPGEQWQLAD